MLDDINIDAILGQQDPIVQELVHEKPEHGVLIPLKTTQELREGFGRENILITRCPVKAANPAITALRDLLPEEIVKAYPHLRRCAKPCDLPAHLKLQFMNENPQSRQVHTGKSNWIYIILGSESEILQLKGEQEIINILSKVDGMGEEIFLRRVPVPKLPPTSQVMAAMWSQHFWPTVYRKNNPLGPHPAMIARNTEEISEDAVIWMSLAHQVANEAREGGFGEPMGACIIRRDPDSPSQVTIVALAADARWQHESTRDGTGNPMAHGVLRAISMVAQKLVRAEKREEKPEYSADLAFEAFQDSPILESERRVFELEHPCPDGYLCHGLEMYLTHEPCVMCSMAILHSRMGKVVFRHRMPLTGGMCAEDRRCEHSRLDQPDGGRGLGLFWRRELNWSMIAWEWEAGGYMKPLLVDQTIHA